MRLVTYEEKQQNAAASRHRQANVFDPESLRDLAQQSVDGQRYDEEEVETHEGEGVTVCDTRVACQFAEPQP